MAGETKTEWGRWYADQYWRHEGVPVLTGARIIMFVRLFRLILQNQGWLAEKFSQAIDISQNVWTPDQFSFQPTLPW